MVRTASVVSLERIENRARANYQRIAEIGRTEAPGTRAATRGARGDAPTLIHP